MLHLQICDKNSKPRHFFSRDNDTCRQKVDNLSRGVEEKVNTPIDKVDKMQGRPKNGKSKGKK